MSEVFIDGLEVDSTSKCLSSFVLTEQEEPSSNIMHRLASDFFLLFKNSLLLKI